MFQRGWFNHQQEIYREPAPGRRYGRPSPIFGGDRFRGEGGKEGKDAEKKKPIRCIGNGILTYIERLILMVNVAKEC